MQRPSITKSGRWVFGGTVLSKPVQLFTTVMIARLLGPEAFGGFGLATSMAVTLALIAGFGLGDASYKYVAEYYSKDKVKGRQFAAVIMWSGTICSACLFATLWLLRGLWADVVFPASTSDLVIGLCLCLAWLNLIFALVTGLLSGLQLFKEFAIVNAMQAIAVAIFAVFLTWYGAGGALLAYVLGLTLSLAWGMGKLVVTDNKLFAWPSVSAFQELKGILRFSIPIWIGAFALSPIVTLTFVFLAHQPNGEYHLGILNTANGLRMLVTILPGAIGTVITPALIQEGGVLGDQDGYKRLLEKAFSALVFITLPLLIVCLFLGDLILLIYGKSYEASFQLFMPLSTSATIGAIGTPLVIVMMAKNRTAWSLGFGVARSLLLIALALWWVPSQYSVGLAWALFASEVFFYVLALEFCVGIRAVPSETRAVFYSATVATVVLLVVALMLPVSWRWALAAPLCAFTAVYLLRTKEGLRTWLTSVVPGQFQASTQRILRLITA